MARSMLNHIRTRPRHVAYRYLFDELDNELERLKAIVKGYDDVHSRRGIVSITQMYHSMLAWEKALNFIMVRFEDLVGPKGGGDLEQQHLAIRRILNHLGYGDVRQEVIERIGESAFGKSGTFRRGKAAAWREAFTADEVELFKTYAGDLLIDLGYENTPNW